MRTEISRWPMLNCEDTGKLISLSRDQRVGLWRKMQIRMHIAMCDTCRAYYKFVNSIGVRLRGESSAEIMPADKKEQLRVKLQESLENRK